MDFKRGDSLIGTYFVHDSTIGLEPKSSYTINSVFFVTFLSIYALLNRYNFLIKDQIWKQAFKMHHRFNK